MYNYRVITIIIQIGPHKVLGHAFDSPQRLPLKALSLSGGEGLCRCLGGLIRPGGRACSSMDCLR